MPNHALHSVTLKVRGNLLSPNRTYKEKQISHNRGEIRHTICCVQTECEGIKFFFRVEIKTATTDSGKY